MGTLAFTGAGTRLGPDALGREGELAARARGSTGGDLPGGLEWLRSADLAPDGGGAEGPDGPTPFLVALGGIGGGVTTGTPPAGVVTGSGGKLCVARGNGGGAPERLAPVSVRDRAAAPLPSGGPIGGLLPACEMGGGDEALEAGGLRGSGGGPET